MEDEINTKLILKEPNAKELAEIAKLKYEAEKIALEVEKIRSDRNRPWFISYYFLQAITAGLISIPMMWFLYDKLVKPLARAEVIEQKLQLQIKEVKLKDQEQVLKEQEKKLMEQEKIANKWLDDLNTANRLTSVLREDLWKSKKEFKGQLSKIVAELEKNDTKSTLVVKGMVDAIKVPEVNWDLKAVTVQIPGTEETLVIIKVPLPNNEYKGIKTKKQAIVLHGIAGWGKAESTWNDWANDDRGAIASTYLIERDGSIYEFFEPEFYAWHLGKSDPTFHKGTISIEFSNWSYLKSRDGLYYNYINRPMPSNEVTKLNTPFRGHKYWHSTTDEQYTAISKLLKYLTARFDIPMTFVSDIDHFVSAEESREFYGILSHSNIRLDKFDMGGVDWERIIEESGGTVQDH